MDSRDEATQTETHGLTASRQPNDGTPDPRAPGFNPFDLEHIFKYHATDGKQLARYVRLREAARVFAIAIVQDVPAGADQSAAIRHVREAVMTANVAIALGGRLAP